MPRETLTKLNADSALDTGLGLVAATDYTFANDGTMLFSVASAAPQTVTVVRPLDDCGDRVDKTIAIDAGTEKLLGPYPTSYNDAETNLITFQLSGAASIIGFHPASEA